MTDEMKADAAALHAEIAEKQDIRDDFAQLQEEFAECTVAINHYLRKRVYWTSNICEELADVGVMLQRMQVHFGIADEDVEKVRARKLHRAHKRIVLNIPPVDAAEFAN